jgi:hypothetical protein
MQTKTNHTEKRNEKTKKVEIKMDHHFEHDISNIEQMLNAHSSQK